MNTLVVANWGKFQHYKNRNPPWIKLHTSLLDDYEFQLLPGEAKWQLLLIWLIAARQDNRIPDDKEWLESLLRVGREDLKVDLLVERGWLLRVQSPDASAETLSPNASINAEHQPIDQADDVSTTAVQLQANTTESAARARDPQLAEF